MRFAKFLCLALVIPVGIAESKAAATAASSALQALKSIDYRYFVAGGTCAAISHGITTPIDVVKTTIQSNPRKYNKGLAASALEIIKEDGPGVLLGGFGPTVVGYGIEGAVKFGVYEIMKPVFADLFKSMSSDPGAGHTAIAFLLASVVAGAAAAFLLCPMESTRIKMVTDKSYKGKNIWTGLAKIASDEGMGSIFACLWAMLSKQIPYTFGKQVSFDVFAKMLYQLYHRFQDQLPVANASDIKWVVSVIAAFCASLIACILSQPGDMILTETYRPLKGQRFTNKESRTFSNVINRLYQEGGAGRFFAGTNARIVHVGVIITTQLVIYDIVKQMLGLPPTGAH
ncbi:hypothetical protein ACA910_015212 [Epithemia clementina (nom. ined.)]